MQSKELGIDAEVNRFRTSDHYELWGAGHSCALVVDGVVKIAGKLPKVQEIKELINEEDREK